MSYKYFRFYLSNNLNNNFIKHYTSILEERKNDGFIRASFDLIGTEKSFSILCKSKKDIHAEKNEWLNYLKTKKILISQKIEHGELEEKKHYSGNHSCSHHHEHHGHSHEHHGHSHWHHEHGHEHYGHSHNHESHWLKAALGMIFGLCLLGMQLIGFNFSVIFS
ncbi:MAG TPA: hypothetical protein PLD88_05045, partial [Candidatus Berkiella sp.]|nr:hypothetical protein [Candidatus Berkiella sp.]